MLRQRQLVERIGKENASTDRGYRVFRHDPCTAKPAAVTQRDLERDYTEVYSVYSLIAYITTGYRF